MMEGVEGHLNALWEWSWAFLGEESSFGRLYVMQQVWREIGEGAWGGASTGMLSPGLLSSGRTPLRRLHPDGACALLFVCLP